jgi:hypothetical protein
MGVAGLGTPTSSNAPGKFLITAPSTTPQNAPAPTWSPTGLARNLLEDVPEGVAWCQPGLFGSGHRRLLPID